MDWKEIMFSSGKVLQEKTEEKAGTVAQDNPHSPVSIFLGRILLQEKEKSAEAPLIQNAKTKDDNQQETPPENQGAPMLRAKITDACTACGACLRFSEFIEEKTDGTAAIKGTGIIPLKAKDAFDQIIKSCPLGAIVLEEEKSIYGTKEDLGKAIQTKLIEFKIPYPDASKLKLHKTVFDSFPMYERTGYTYSSDSQAGSHGLDRFDTIAYSRRKIAIQEYLVAFKVDCLTPYYRFEQKAGNFYYDLFRACSAQIEELVAQVKLILPDAAIPSDIAEYASTDFPTKELYQYNTYWMEHFEEGLAQEIADEFAKDNPLRDYKVYVNTDDTEVYVGGDLRGKLKTKYNYDLREVLETFKKDLLWLLDFRGGGSARDDINASLDCVLKNFKAETKRKGELLLHALQTEP